MRTRGVFDWDPRDDFDDDWDDYGLVDDAWTWCDRCDGEGAIMVCPDDMCRGAGECFGKRGKGWLGKGCFRACEKCKGTGELPARA